MIYQHSENKRLRIKQLILLFLPFIVLVAVFLNFQINRLISQVMVTQSNAFSSFIQEIDIDTLDQHDIKEIQSLYTSGTKLALIRPSPRLKIYWQNFEQTDELDAIIQNLRVSSETSEYGKSASGYWIANQIKQGSGNYWFVEHYPKALFDDLRVGTASVWLGIIILFLFLLYLAYRIILVYIAKPIRVIDEGLQRVLEDDFTFEYYGTQFKDVDHLGRTVTSLKDKLVESRKDLVSSEQRLSILLDHLNLGVVLISPDHRIELFNPEAQNLLQFDQSTIGRTYETTIQSYVLVDMISRVIEESKGLNDEIEIFLPKQKYIDVNIIPFDDLNQFQKTGQSVLVLLYDISKIIKLETIRSEFVANASHELRTPVTAIKGFAETLQDGALKQPEMAEKFVKIIANESVRLEKLIHDILELSRVEKRSEPLHHEAFDVIQSVEDIIEFLSVKAKVRNIQIHTYYGQPQIIMHSDSGRIKQILINLLDNAITYSGLGKEIEIRVYQDMSHVYFSIKDNGVGIPYEDQKRIFERFYRVDKGRSRNSGGTGLGLSIVKNLVNLLEGSIELASEPDQGTEFSLTLPLDSK